MGIINVREDEADAIKAIDLNALRNLIARCIDEEQGAAIRSLMLDNCGPYIYAKLRSFEQDLASYAKAKAPKKRAETECDVRKAGRDLEYAVAQMRARVATEEQEGKLFFVEDRIVPPSLISQHLRVLVSYRWRASAEEDWKYGSVTFLHDVVFHGKYPASEAARKPSTARQRRDRDDELYRQWEYLRDLGLQAVRDHLRREGSGAGIPKTVQAKPDPHTQSLNNFSAKF